MLMFLIYILSFLTSFESLPVEIKNKLEAEFASYKKVEFEVIKVPKDFKSIHLDEKKKINIIGNTAYIPVEIVDKKGHKKRTTLSVRVKIYEDVFVAMNDIKKYDRLKAIDFQLMEKEVSSLRGETVKSLGEIIDARASRFISKGDILTSESIEKMPVIFPGDKVNASSIVGHVQISFSAFANQEGRIGDVIRIRTSDNKIYKAEVIDNQNVLIVE